MNQVTPMIRPLMLILLGLLLGGWALAQDSQSPSDEPPVETPAESNTDVEQPPVSEDAPTEDPLGSVGSGAPSDSTTDSEAIVAPKRDMIASLTIFVLAVFVGFEVITKVPPTLHTPLMSGSNAISGITLVGAVIVASAVIGGLQPGLSYFARFLGFIAVVLATVNVVGGFLVTHRMLAMFKKK